MIIQDIMTVSPDTCTAEHTLREAAAKMADGDFGAIAVIDNDQRPTGILTDRDIAVRGVAQGHGPETAVGQIMSQHIQSVNATDDIDTATRLMEEQQIRRLVAVDKEGRIAGIIAVADIARATGKEAAGEVVSEVSK